MQKPFQVHPISPIEKDKKKMDTDIPKSKKSEPNNFKNLLDEEIEKLKNKS